MPLASPVARGGLVLPGLSPAGLLLHPLLGLLQLLLGLLYPLLGRLHLLLGLLHLLGP